MSRKKSKISLLGHLPHKVRKAIGEIRELLIDRFHPDMIILFGSYADRIAWHRHSDIDMLIVLETNDRALMELRMKRYILDNLPKPSPVGRTSNGASLARIFSPIVETPERLNEQLAIGQYFFKEIVEKGRILYDTGRFSLAEMRVLTNKEYKALVTKDFEYWRESAEDFLDGSQYYFSKGKYKKAAFHLHQVCESSYHTVELVFTRKSSKTHDLNELYDICLPFLPELTAIFPKDTDFSDRAYSRLRHAYTGARYDQKYEIEKAELEYLAPRVKRLLELATGKCRAYLESLPEDGKLRKENA